MANRWDPRTDMPSLEGKKIILTGGTSGIGTQTVKFLALRGATVYLAARSEKKATATINNLVQSNSHIQQGQIIWIPLDLADLRSVAGAADALKSKVESIDILINNASVCNDATTKLGDNWEPHMATNFVGTFAFTNAILPLLKNATKQKNADVRIVTLSSHGTKVFLSADYPFEFTSPSFLQQSAPYYPWSWRLLGKYLFAGTDMIRYARSKAALIIFAQELQRLLDAQNLPILSIVVHPGDVSSEGLLSVGSAFLKFLLPYVTVTPEEGAITPLFAATAREVKENSDQYRGKYLEPYGKVGDPPKVADNKVQVRGVWENATAAVNVYLQKISLPHLQEW